MALEDLVDLDGLGEESGPSSSGKGPIHMVGIGWVIREYPEVSVRPRGSRADRLALN